MTPARVLSCCLAMVALAGCELTEVTVAPGTHTVVVQGVVDRSSDTQFVVVEYSLTGNEQGGPTGEVLPPESPAFPISGAEVTIEHLGPGGCQGVRDTLLERSPAVSGATASGTYEAAVCAPDPGAVLLLTVRTPDGGTVQGTTTVPGTLARSLTVAGRSAQPGDTAVVNRLTDELDIAVTPESGRGLQVEARQGGRPERLAVYAITDTMAITLPGDLINPFEGDSGEAVFRAGRYYDLAVVLADTNYFDFVRSRSDPLTGRGFINRLAGGVGVFGSVDVARYTLKIRAPMTDRREGTYRLQGALDGRTVDLSLELFLDDVDPGAFSAFLEGSWTDGPVVTSGDGWFEPRPLAEPASLDAFVFTFDAPSAAGETVSYVLRGSRTADRSPFAVSVSGFLPAEGDRPMGVITAWQTSGP